MASGLPYRIGINIGDIVVEDNDIYGDGVNVAARLEGLGEGPGCAMNRRSECNVHPATVRRFGSPAGVW